MKAAALAALLALVPFALAGCNGGDDGPVVPRQDSEGRYVVEMTASNRFDPDHFQVPANATVVFENRAGAHDVQVSGPETFSSGEPARLAAGKEFEIRVTKPGRYEFRCNAHHAQGMYGEFTVLAQDASAAQ